MPVDNDAAAVSSSSSREMPMPMGLMKVLVMRSDPVTGTAVTTEKQAMQSMALTGTPI